MIIAEKTYNFDNGAESTSWFMYDDDGGEADKAEKKYLTSSVIGATSLGYIKNQDGMQLINELTKQYSNDSVVGSNQESFLIAASEDREYFVQHRVSKLFDAACKGLLNTSDLQDEARLSDFEIIWLNKDGIVCNNREGAVTPGIHGKGNLLENFEAFEGEDVYVAKDMSVAELIEQNPELNAFVFCQDNSKVGYSDSVFADQEAIATDQHIQLVKVDNEGNITPFVTILDSNHPAVEDRE